MNTNKKKPILKKFILTLVLLSVIGLSCQRVPITGRKQLNLVPNSLIQAMALTEYDSFLSVTRVLPQSNIQTQMVNRVGNSIQKAVEAYMNQNNLAKDLKNFKWEFNL